MTNKSHSIEIKKDILIKLVRAFFSDDFERGVNAIPIEMRPKGANIPFRCCIHKERAIIRDRAIADLGFSIEEDDEITPLSEYAKMAVERETPDVRPLTVLEDACKGCVPSEIYVTDLCKGCVARPCESACKFGAISVKDGRSEIDGQKCKGCKLCMSACPYNAIVKLVVPCEDACPTGAIAKNSNGLATIDYDECISCGRCTSSCPFGAIHEKSQIIDVMKFLKSKDAKVAAMFAPAIAGQFGGNLGQLKSAILKAGFDDVFEVAHGADVTTKTEAKEFKERMAKGESFMTTSCCAGYNELVKKHLQEIQPFVSNTKTPLFYTAQMVREKYKDWKLVFISPCTAKRKEVQDNPDIDFILSAEELGALFAGRDIEVASMEDFKEENPPSKQGRNYCLTGGVQGAVCHLLSNEDEAKPYIINGLNKDTIKELKKFAKQGKIEGYNLVEVMACYGGCIGGNTTIASMKDAKKNIENILSDSEDL